MFASRIISTTFVLLFFLLVCNRSEPYPKSITHSVYVWQRIWSDELRTAIDETEMFQSLSILTHQIEPDGSIITVATDRNFLSLKKDRTLTAVIRISSEVSSDTWDTLPSIIAQLLEENQPHWSGVQIDYDCPESKLSRYKRNLQKLNPLIPEEWKLSITALPTWCNSRSLRSLARVVDYSVIQVHSVDDPRQGIFNSERAEKWVRRYSEIVKRPFTVAIPCYGSKVYFNSDGTVAGIESETIRSDINHLQSEELHVDPVDIDSFLRAIETTPVPYLQGYIWFRLPTERDRRSWDRKTLKAVITREPISTSISIVTEEKNGTTDISIRNSGYGNGSLPIVAVHGNVSLSEPLFAYSKIVEAGVITFYPISDTALTYDDQIPVGWIRGDSSITLKIEEN